MSNWMFVGAAFVLTWSALVGYLFHLQRTMRRARFLLERTASGVSR
jgi:CcmD family protein